MNQNNISWQASEFKHYQKNLGWYVTLVAITILALAFFVIVEKDIFAAVCLGLISILIILFSLHSPKTVNIELNKQGVKIGDLFHPYKQIKHFWVVNDEHHRTINLQTSALVNNTLILELESQDPEVVRLYLLRFIPEHPQSEPTAAQRIMHRFKF